MNVGRQLSRDLGVGTERDAERGGQTRDLFDGSVGRFQVHIDHGCCSMSVNGAIE